jgi:F420-dependent oxidoreductase-like protein
MRVGAAFWLQRTSWPEIREAARAAEAAGVDDVWVDDHLLNDEGDLAAPKLEGWATLSAIAAATSRVRLGLLVSANTFRNPGLTAKLATTLDHVSNGRAILGLGAGWFEPEHQAFGIDFGATTGDRLDRLVEAVPLVRRLLDGERVSSRGRFYAMEDAVCRPLPLQPHLPILIGGSGPRKTIPLVARFADLWNLYGSPTEVAAADAVLRERCAEIGRDPDAIVRSVTQNALIRPSRAAAVRAWQGVLARHRPEEGEDLPDLVGTVDDVADRLRAYAEIGVMHSIWVFRSPFDLETIARLPEVRGRLRA